MRFEHTHAPYMGINPGDMEFGFVPGLAFDMPGLSPWVRISGSWLPCKVWVKVAGTWKPAKVWNRVSGTWEPG